MMNAPTVNAEKSIKLPGLVTRDYCILAAISRTHLRAGTLWTDADEYDYIVNGKNYHRPTNEVSVVTIERLRATASGTPLIQVQDSAETTAVGMMEIVSVDDRYEQQHIVTYKDYEAFAGSQWIAVVWGTPVAGSSESALIDPYVTLSQNQLLLAARVGDSIREGATQRPYDKEYTRLGNNAYSVKVISQNGTRTSSSRFTRDDMFRTLAVGDTYIDQHGNWTVKEKRVFYLETTNGIERYGREILVTSKPTAD